MSINQADLQQKKQTALGLFSRSRLMEARQACEEVIRQDPSDPVILCLLGVIYGALKQYARSVEFLNRSVEIDPEYTEAHYNLGIALRHLGKVEEAGREFEYVIARDGDQINALMALGYVKMSLGEYREAVDCYRAVQGLEQGRQDAVAAEAEIYEKQGDDGRAWETIKPYLSAGLGDPELAIIYGKLARRQGSHSAAINRLEAFIGAHEIPAESLARLRFLLGDLCDDIGKFDSAFEHYRTGNELKGVYFDSYRYRHDIMQQINRFSQAKLERYPRSGFRSKLPIFIVGMPRSGTSLVEQILSSHREVHGAGELTDIGKLVEPLTGKKRYGFHEMDAIDLLSAGQLDEMARRYIDRLAALSPESLRITDKMPGNFHHLGFIELLFPAARVIHCRRNAVDTCLSCYFQNFAAIHDYSFRLEDVARYYLGYRRLMTHWEKVLEIPIHEVVYEQLVEDPEREIRRLIEFSGLEWDEQCLRFYEKRRIIRTASYDQANRPIYRQSVNRWRNYEKHITRLTALLEGHV